MRRTALVRALALGGVGTGAVAAAALLALVEVLWLPLRVGGVLVPVSLAAVVIGNVVLVDLAHRASRSKVVALLPALTWFVVAGAASMRRPEGDLLIVGAGDLGAVGLAFLLLGVGAAAVGVGRILAVRPPARISRPVREPDPAGSGSGGAR
jgi:hypothetical protein